MTPDTVITRLEQAGVCLLSMAVPLAIPSVIQDDLDSYGWSARPPMAVIPSESDRRRMYVAFGWLDMIPTDRYVLRRVVAARCLVHPTTDRYLFPWRRLATSLGADCKAVQRWHAEGIGLIVAGLEGRP